MEEVNKEQIAEVPVSPDLLDKLNIEDEVLAGFAAEYKKLQDNLRTARKSESKFLSRCRDMVNQAEEINKIGVECDQLILKHEEVLRETGGAFQELEDKATAAKKGKEEKERKIEDLKQKLIEYDKTIEETGISIDQKHKERILKLEDRIKDNREIISSNLSVLTEVRQENTVILEKKNKIFNEKVELEQAISILEDKYSDIKMQSRKEADRKRNSLREISDLEMNMSAHQAEIQEAMNNIKRIEENIVHEKKRMQNFLDNVEVLKRDIEEYENRAREGKNQIFEVSHRNKKVSSTVEELCRELENVKAKASKTNREANVLQKMILSTQAESKIVEAKVAKGEKKKSDIEKDMDKMKTEVKELQFKHGLLTRDRDALLREKDCLKSEKHAKKSNLEKQKIQERVLTVQLKSIENDASSYEHNAKNLFLKIDQLQQEHEALNMEFRKRTLQTGKAREEVQKRTDVISNRTISLQSVATNRAIYDNQAENMLKIQDLEAKLKSMSRMITNVKKERLLHTEQLATQKVEIAEYNRTLTEFAIRIRHLKQEIQDQDISILTEHLNLKHTNERLENLTQQCKRLAQQIKDKKVIIAENKEKIETISKLIEVAEDELHEQKKLYDNIQAEQKILNQQLTAHNGTLHKLYDEIHIQQSVLTKGEVAYQERMKQIVQTRKERDEVEQTLDGIRNEIERFDELKVQIGHVQRDIIQEKLRTKALLEEMKKSVNIHRWRLLKDTDTEAYDKIKQVHLLQRQIMRKSAKAEVKDSMIREREKLYEELRRVLARQPGREEQEKLQMFASTVKQKKGELRAMRDELKMYQARVYECKYDIEKINKDMELLKQEFFHLKMKGRRAAAAESMRKSAEAQLHNSDVVSQQPGLEEFYRENPQLLHSSKPPKELKSRLDHA